MSLLVADYGTSDSESEGEQSNSTSADPTNDTKQSSKRKFQLPPPNAISSNDKFSLPPANPSTSAALPMRNVPSTTVESSRPVSSLARPKKVKGPVRIYLPSVSDAESNDDENGDEEKSNCSKKLKTGGGKSALFAMLPKPKNLSAPKVTAMMPASVAAKGKEKGKGKETVEEKTRNQTEVTIYRPQGEKREEDVDDTDQDYTDIARTSPFHEPIPSAADEPSTASSSFFNRFRTEEGGQDDGEDTLQGPSVAENGHNQNPYDQYYTGEQYPQENLTYQQNWESYPDPYTHDQYYQEPSTQQQPLETADVLDAETLAKLGGFRGRHRGPIHIQTVDVSQAVGPYNPIKNASAPTSTNESSYSHLKPSRMQKSKHNIMALAFQAKSMEDKLQESWSQSRKTKRQTQAKYGF